MKNRHVHSPKTSMYILQHIELSSDWKWGYCKKRTTMFMLPSKLKRLMVLDHLRHLMCYDVLKHLTIDTMKDKIRRRFEYTRERHRTGSIFWKCNYGHSGRYFTFDLILMLQNLVNLRSFTNQTILTVELVVCTTSSLKRSRHDEYYSNHELRLPNSFLA